MINKYPGVRTKNRSLINVGNPAEHTAQTTLVIHESDKFTLKSQHAIPEPFILLQLLEEKMLSDDETG